MYKMQNSECDSRREVLLSNHTDHMDVRLLTKKVRVYFSLCPPSADIKWDVDELYCFRWWEPKQKKMVPLDDPDLKVCSLVIAVNVCSDAID